MTNLIFKISDIEKVIKSYCDCLVKNDFDRIMQLFAAQACIKSPLFSQKNANEFYFDLFKSSTRIKVDIKNLFCDVKEPNVFAAYLDYEGISKNKQYQFNCIDIFEFDNSMKIKKLTIIWDTYPMRFEL